jgi:hypothetical protein
LLFALKYSYFLLNIILTFDSGLDLVVKECLLPELDIGEFMIFKNMGAYTISGAVPFNGIPLARCIYVVATSWDTIKEAFVESADEQLYMQNINNNSSTCAAAATLAFSRALSSIQQNESIDEINVKVNSMSIENINDELNINEIGLNDENCMDSNSPSAVDCPIIC